MKFHKRRVNTKKKIKKYIMFQLTLSEQVQKQKRTLLNENQHM